MRVQDSDIASLAMHKGAIRSSLAARRSDAALIAEYEEIRRLRISTRRLIRRYCRDFGADWDAATRLAWDAVIRRRPIRLT